MIASGLHARRGPHAIVARSTIHRPLLVQLAIAHGCPVSERASATKRSQQGATVARLVSVAWRCPLLRPAPLRKGVSEPVPVDVALFAEGGIASSRSGAPSVSGATGRAWAVWAPLCASRTGFAVLLFNLPRPERGNAFQA